MPPTAAAFELCEVCNINHNHGRRHRYQSTHRRALAAVLTRFKSNLTDLRFFLEHPSPLSPDHAALNRLWCVFCSRDLRELDSAFACGNAIRHLASAEHVKSVKEFFQRHGGGMDRVEEFRISGADFIKWEKGCNAASSVGEVSIGPQPGPSKDIQQQITANHADSFQNYSVSSISSSVTNNVMPLQSFTYEDYSRCQTGGTGFQATPPSWNVASSVPVAVQESIIGVQTKHMDSNSETLIGSSLSNGSDSRTASAQYHQTENVHTGAPPPWLDTSKKNDKERLIRGPKMNKQSPPSPQTLKSKKLNPKRVGAAWAERRRVELELEKKGERVPSSCDTNWLPNFGRVWQSGTRKESRKEFEKEKPVLFKDENPSEETIQLQPYISKRMRLSASENGCAVTGHAEDLNTM